MESFPLQKRLSIPRQILPQHCRVQTVHRLVGVEIGVGSPGLGKLLVAQQILDQQHQISSVHLLSVLTSPSSVSGFWGVVTVVVTGSLPSGSLPEISTPFWYTGMQSEMTYSPTFFSKSVLE